MLRFPRDRRRAVDLALGIDELKRIHQVRAVVALVPPGLREPADRAGPLDVAIGEEMVSRRAERRGHHRLVDVASVSEAMMTSPFCPTGNHFLPDRYVEGTCPICGFPKARGDQCDNCTNLMDPFQLIDPKCKIHGTTPVPRETKHFFFRLTAFQERLAKWASEDKEHWRHHVLTFTRSWLQEGLKDRPITRDLDWGVEVPVPGYETKRIYVWVEAVMRYLTATKEGYRRRNQ